MVDFQKIYDGILKGFKMLGEVGLVGGVAMLIIAIVAIVFGIVANVLTSTTFDIPDAINTSITSMVTAFSSLVANLVTGYGIAASLVILAVVIVVFGFIFVGKKGGNDNGGLGY